MHKLPLRIVLAVLIGLFGLRSAEAARISVSEGSDTGGGTIINDGSGDVSSSNGSSSGFTDLLSALGVSDGSLEADLANLGITGMAIDTSGQSTTATLSVLRVFGTLAVPCVDCANIDNVKVGGFLAGHPSVSNVLFAFDIVGGALNTPWPTPTALGPQPIGLNQPVTYQLTQDQIDFIVARMGNYSVNDVRIGLGAMGGGDASPVRLEFETTTVPEPATMLLFGTGVIPVMLRRRRTSH